jgi:hypothetical protein
MVRSSESWIELGYGVQSRLSHATRACAKAKKAPLMIKRG